MLTALKAKFAAEAPKLATRQASGMVLDALAPVLPELVGGSADLTGSNNTKAKGQKMVTRDDFAGSYIHYGVREHGMAAAMNGHGRAWRHHSLWRHLPGLQRLLPPGDPALGADAAARHLCHDA